MADIEEHMIGLPNFTESTSGTDPTHSDHVFATKHGIPLYLRVHPAPSSAPGSASGMAKPWLIHFHGGGYCSGSHLAERKWITEMAHSLGMHYVSSAYRLLPHADLKDMVEDCHDAVTWSRENLPSLLGEQGGCDPDNYVIAGSSAGGGLATMLMPKLKDKPRAFLNVYGTTNLKELQEHLESDMVQSLQGSRANSGISSKEWRDEYYKSDPTKACTMTRTTNLNKKLASSKRTEDGFSRALQAAWQVSDQDWEAMSRGEQAQWDFSVRAHSRALVDLLECEHGLPDMSPEERQAALDALVPTLESSYPPTVILQGEADVVVPVGLSKGMERTLKSNGVETLGIYVPNMGHESDWRFREGGFNQEHVDAVSNFISKYTRTKTDARDLGEGTKIRSEYSAKL